jgi:hypothetical protein
MMLAVWRPTAIAGVILNDIGPLIEPRGLVRIKGYVGKLPIPRSFEGAEILRWWFGAQFPKLAPQDWIAFAQRTWREHGGGLVPDYDLKLARTLQGASRAGHRPRRRGAVPGAAVLQRHQNAAARACESKGTTSPFLTCHT